MANFRFFMWLICDSNFRPISFIFTEAKKDDTFGQDDKDWDVYKEIVSYSTVVCTKSNMPQSIANCSILLL